MGLTTIAFMNGFSALCLFVLGLYFCFRYILYYKQQKKKLLPYVGLLALSLGSMYLGPTVAFITKFMTGQDIDVVLYGFLTYIHYPVVLSLAMYLGYNIFKPHLRWRMLLIYSLLGVVYLVAMVGWPSSMITATAPVENELMDVNIHSVVLIIAIFYILSTFVMLGGNFIFLRKKLEDAAPRLKAMQLGIGWILFGVVGILETFNPLNIAIIPRSIMFIGFIFIFTGFAPLKKDT